MTDGAATTDIEAGITGAPREGWKGPAIEDIIDALRTVNDPEIPLNIFDLGLVYKINTNEEGIVGVEMTLTAPGCPVSGQIIEMVEAAVKTVGGVTMVIVNLVFDPPWDPDKLTDEAKLQLGML